jgi:nifR3 family TIM-barrel protein
MSTPTLTIGKVPVGLPAVQAALSGYSDSPFRRIARRFGAPYAVAEMILDELLTTPGKKRNRHLHLTADDHPVGGQIAGSRPENFAPAARELVEAGFEVVDINFGCPLNKVLGRCRGGYLLSVPDTALEIIDRVREAVPPHVPVTVKMRRGLDDTAESREKFFRIFDGAWARGVSAITVHGRTVRQKYVGPSRWEFLAEVKRRAGTRTILGSGDLYTPRDIVEMLRVTGVDGVTVARGSIGNPWIFAETAALLAGRPLPPPPTVTQQRAVIEEHFRLTVEMYGLERGGALMRKHAIKYARRHPEAAAVKMAMIGLRRPADWAAVLDRWYPPGDDRPGLPTLPPDEMSESESESADGCGDGGSETAESCATAAAGARV